MSRSSLIYFQIHTLMSDWSAPISRLESALRQAAKTKLLSQLPSSSYSVHKPNSNEQAYFVNTISTLLQLGNIAANTNIHKIVSNVHFMAFALAWFGLVSLHVSTHSIFTLLTICLSLCREKWISPRRGRK